MAVADIVAVVTQAIDGQDATDKLRCFLVHRVDVELHQQVLTVATVLAGLLVVVVARATLAPHVANGQIYQKIVIGLSQLQKTLTELNILHQIGCVAPDAIRRTHINAGIELPARPRIILGRVARTMEVDVVNATGEHQVEVGLHL